MHNFTNDKNFNFALIYGSLLKAEMKEEIKETDKVVFSKLLVRYRGSCANNYRDEVGTYLFYTLEQMAADCNISESTAKRSMNNLAKLGYISKSKNGSKANKIYIQDPVISEDILLGVYKVSKVGTIAPSVDTNNAYYIDDETIVNDIGGLGVSSCISDGDYFEDYNSLFETSEVKMNQLNTNSEVILNTNETSEVILTPNYYTSIKSSNNYSNTNNNNILSSNTILNNKGLERTDSLSTTRVTNTPRLLNDSTKRSIIAEFREKVSADFFESCYIGQGSERKNAMAKYIVQICEKLLCATYPVAYKEMYLTSVDIDSIFEKVDFSYLEEVLRRVENANMKHPFTYIRSTILDVLMAGEVAFEYNVPSSDDCEECYYETPQEEVVAEPKQSATFKPNTATNADDMNSTIAAMLGVGM